MTKKQSLRKTNFEENSHVLDIKFLIKRTRNNEKIKILKI